MVINIKDREIEIKPTMRSLVIFEMISKKSFDVLTLNDVLVYFYSNVLACNKLDDITYDDFMDFIDENPEAVMEFRSWMTNEQNFIAYMNRLNGKANNEKKTRTKKQSK